MGSRCCPCCITPLAPTALIWTTQRTSQGITYSTQQGPPPLYVCRNALVLPPMFPPTSCFPLITWGGMHGRLHVVARGVGCAFVWSVPCVQGAGCSVGFWWAGVLVVAVLPRVVEGGGLAGSAQGLGTNVGDCRSGWEQEGEMGEGDQSTHARALASRSKHAQSYLGPGTWDTVSGLTLRTHNRTLAETNGGPLRRPGFSGACRAPAAGPDTPGLPRRAAGWRGAPHTTQHRVHLE